MLDNDGRLMMAVVNNVTAAPGEKGSLVGRQVGTQTTEC